MMSKESGMHINPCKDVFNMYHTKYPGIKERMDRIESQLKRSGRMETGLGRRRYFFADPNKDLFNVAYAWPNQSTIGEVTNLAMCTLRTVSERMGNPLCKPVLNTHDGLIPRIKLGTREECISLVLKAFNIPLKLRGLTIRIPVSIGFGPNFNDNFDEKVYFYDVEI
jgi:DNA polymerase I-like protein with 3'-5' exonuclease and polymerase domains